MPVERELEDQIPPDECLQDSKDEFVSPFAEDQTAGPHDETYRKTFHFEANELDRLQSQGRSTYFDRRTPALSCVTLADGRQRFDFNAQDGRRIVLGKRPDLSLERARQKAAELRRLESSETGISSLRHASRITVSRLASDYPPSHMADRLGTASPHL